MADYIDQNSLPGVKEVCRDFALLEDHSLAQSLQDQEIESHLASNVHRSRLMQQDLRVARRLQQEENLRASIRRQQVHKAVECRDSEMAMEIQEELVKQERQNRHLEEKDEAFARKLQEKEMKEQRRRKKQKEPMIEEEYYEDQDRNEQAHYDIMEVTQGLDDLDVQEVRDMEVARRIQEEELMVRASRADKQAAQVAQDEEIAWLIMEEEEEKYKKCKNRDKRLSKKDRKLQQEDWTPLLQEESEHLKSQKQRPERPPAPVLNCDYVESISYPRPTFSSQAPARPQSRPSFKVELPQEALISKDLR
ncbi:coiled-coil domain-containing protein 50 isoform X5 [Paramormyrops kingsleyae]|uniref:coiled-coil domain-containing protein 50 isoform X5 n=1 Tax=Paramormyrops kingsleyae TaxID=1676925 RepID=UPI000CD6230F|nr:coiled-coil domain-containing protein 50 isoform X4 [Paramormyrops kingsleyae]